MTWDEEDLQRLDASLMRLRRLWTGPRAAAGRPAEGGLHDGGVELSTVLVVDAAVRRPEPVTVGEVASHLDVAPSTGSRLVDRAVAAGMVTRSPDPSDTRRSIVRPTPAGLELHERAAAFRAEYLASVLQGWSPGELHTFVSALDRFAESVSRSDHRPEDVSR
jgi:DNA-binding MarR family transcriptional regulator